jgi:hypothetical protein
MALMNQNFTKKIKNKDMPSIRPNNDIVEYF